MKKVWLLLTLTMILGIMQCTTCFAAAEMIPAAAQKNPLEQSLAKDSDSFWNEANFDQEKVISDDDATRLAIQHLADGSGEVVEDILFIFDGS